MTIIIKQMLKNAVSFIQGWRGVTTERGLFDSYISGMFPAEKK